MALTKIGKEGITGISNSSDANAITIDSSERVGIGNSTPSSYENGATNLVVGNTSDTGMTIASGTSNLGSIFFADGTSGGAKYEGQIRYSHASNFMIFATDETERMRIGANGHLYATNNDGSLANLTLRNGSSSDSVDFVQCRDSGNNLELKIEGDGDVYNTNNTYGSLSDETLKENISNANSQWNDIKSVKVKNYSMIADGLDTANRIGVIAQELETAGMNGLVNQQEDGTKFVKYSVLYMKAVKALQEAMTRIETLEAKVATLEGE